MERASYPSDLTDKEWQWIAPLLPVPEKPGRPRQYPLREILNAIFFVGRTGGQWRALSHDFPKGKPGHPYFRVWG